MNNADKLAFPNGNLNEDNEDKYVVGLSRREYFAAKAMQGMLAAGRTNSIDNMHIPKLVDRAFAISYMMTQKADALIEDLKKC